MTDRTSPEVNALVKAAEPFAVCTHGWHGMGYGGNYSCLDREVDIANTEHYTTDWWPNNGPCEGCELRRVFDGLIGPRRSYGTETMAEQKARFREEDDRREYQRLTAKFANV